MASYKQAPAMSIDVSKKYSATIETSRGPISVELFAQDAPLTVNNFVFLSREGFYNGTKFHRVISNFMVQGGDPTGTGTGGPGYKFADERNNRKHESGTLSMANAGPNTNGSQFFITHEPQPHLNGKHTIFGQVTDGQKIVDSIRQGDTITSVTINES